MILPDRWGQGQLFAFSALDGRALASDDFPGMLCGDRVGVRFFSHVRRELAIVPLSGPGLTFDAVTSDCIVFGFPGQDRMRMLYARPHLIIGQVTGSAMPAVFVEGPCRLERDGDTEIHDTLDGDFTVLERRVSSFAFAFGHSREEVCLLARESLSLSLEAEEKHKLAFYARHGVSDTHPYARLYAKCLSVMKSQLYAPEGEFTTVWSTPDRLPHRHMWLWDSIFHAVGFRHVDASLAQDLIRAVWVHQRPDGFIPHMADVGQTSDITQPPVIAWGAWQVYAFTRDKAFLREAYEHNARFLAWCRESRRLTARELYTWNTTSDVNCRCDESGMDNSPRIDVPGPLEAIDFSCYMANDVRHMALIARALGLEAEAVHYEGWFRQIRDNINALLWSEEDGFYFDFDLSRGALHRVWSAASFLPLFAEVCPPDRAGRLAEHLQDPASFATAFPIPSISRKAPPLTRTCGAGRYG
ncbi:MAG: trehalase family glycosidase [Eubacteriales bacterium]|nr:trehalase family glycosidase [Eubacteriales bacterium]